MKRRDEIYERYCLLRDFHGYKDAQIARMLSCSASTFSDWKKGKSRPNAQKMVAIAHLLDTTAEYLITGEDVTDYIYGDHKQFISKEENIMLQSWRELSVNQRENVAALMQSFIKQNKHT